MLAVVAWAVGGTMPSASATVVLLTNGNATVAIDTGSQSGIFAWTVDGTGVLKKQWLWYRVGSTGGEKSVDTLTQAALVVSASDPIDNPTVLDTLFVRYTSASPVFEIRVTFTLAGGSPGSRVAAMTEQLSVRNTGVDPLDFHLFEYGDFTLDPLNVLADTVVFPSLNLVNQSNPNGSILDVSTAPIPAHIEVNVFTNAVNTIYNLNDTSPTTLSDVTGPLSGNATWAYEWDPLIAAGGSFQISKNENVTLSQPQQQTQICIHKFYDANADGIDNDTQVVAGVRFDLFGVRNCGGNNVLKTGYTDANGNLCFTNITAGLYSIRECLPNKSWVATTPTSVTTNLATGQTVTYSFGDLCKAGKEGHHKDHWCGKMGQSVLCSNDFAVLNGLCLKNEDGSDRDFKSASLTTNKSDLKNWLQGCRDKNMAYWLSCELAAAQLNLLEGDDDGNCVVVKKGCGERGSRKAYMTINELIAKANASLAAWGNSPKGDSHRDDQECLMRALKHCNKNKNRIQPTPCPFKTPYSCKDSDDDEDHDDSHHHHDDDDDDD